MQLNYLNGLLAELDESEQFDTNGGCRDCPKNPPPPGPLMKRPPCVGSDFTPISPGFTGC